ncbi:MAG: hypothetical protein J0I06_20030 [Planctomycetes bacterium]|nr:hypothetical protein [Planctomycetota bacterium]
MLAVAWYQKRFGRRYPTWTEVLNILRCLGYRKTAEPVPIGEPAPPRPAPGGRSEPAARTDASE